MPSCWHNYENGHHESISENYLKQLYKKSIGTEETKLALPELIYSSMIEEFYPIIQLWKDATDAPFGGVILAWAVITFLGVITTIKLKTTNGMMLGFIITIAGALFIFVNISAESLKAKKEITQIEERINYLQENTQKVEEPPKNQETPKTVPSINNLKKKRENLLTLIEIGAILTNFSSMTLGGLGAGLLTSAALTSRNRDEELEIESPSRIRLLKGLLYIFSFIAISSIITGAGIYALFLAKYISAYPLISLFTATLVGFAISLFLALIGYLLAYRSLKTKDLKLSGAILITLLITLTYTKSMGATVFYTSYWVLLANTTLILVFAAPRTWLYKKAKFLAQLIRNQLQRLNTHIFPKP